MEANSQLVANLGPRASISGKYLTVVSSCDPRLTLGITSQTVPQVSMPLGEYEQQAQSFLDTSWPPKQPQEPSASSSHIIPTYYPPPSQHPFSGGEFAGSWDESVDGMSGYSDFNHAEAYPSASQQSFAGTANLSLDIYG